MKRIFTTTLLITIFGMLSVFAQERIYAPELSLPANGAINQMPDVVLDWNAVTGGNTGIIRYEIQLDTDPAFSSPVIFETEFLSAIQTANLIFGETYFWRVRAIDGTQQSDWSATWSFRVVRRVVLNKPNDASEQNTDFDIGWNQITGITSYEYQLDTTYNWNPAETGLSGHINAVAVVDETHAWMVGAGGKIIFYDGTEWAAQTSGTTKDLFSVSFVDANNGWAAGKGGTILYYNGTEWSEQTSGISTDIKGIYFADNSNGWAASLGGKILYFNGTSWSQQYSIPEDLNGISGIDNNHVWAVGKKGYVLHYDGDSWARQDSVTSRELLNVSFFDANKGYAVGKTGALLEYSQGAWKVNDHGLTTKDLTGVTFMDATTAYIAGKTGTVLQNDGIEWFVQSVGTTTNLLAVDFQGNTGFIGAEGGAAYGYDPDAFTSPIATIHSLASDITTAKLTDLLFGTQYYWRMRAVHSLDISEWSGARSFYTVATVELDKPNNNATDQNLDVLLKWDKISDMVSYEIQVDDDINFGSPLLLGTTNTQINAELLRFGIKYYWRARALHAFDTSAWSEPWNFTTANTVTLTAPANEATDISLSPLLNWADITGITGYQVQVAETSGFDEILVSGLTPADQSEGIVPIVLEKDSRYYWHVRAINGLDTSEWSATWSFTTLPPVGIEEPGFESQFSIYPNPAANVLYVELQGTRGLDIHLSITDLVGKAVLSRDVTLSSSNKTLPIDVAGLKNGLYIIRLSDQENVLTRKLVIKR